MNDIEPNEPTDVQAKQSGTAVEGVLPTSDQDATAAGTQPPASIDDVPPTAPPADPPEYAYKVQHAINNAFLMGWSLQELKSAVLLGALGSSQPSAAGNPAPASGSANGGSAPTTRHSLSDMVEELLQGALASEVSVISQLQGSPGDSNGSLVQTSDLRAIFIRLATAHDQCFPGCTTEKTPYDPGAGMTPESRFPFLYPPESNLDYALTGINNSSSGGVANFDDDKHLGNFQLYDVTRRALNCLALLYTNPWESLLPDLVSDFQRQIVAALGQTQTTESQDGSGNGGGNQNDSTGVATADQENAPAMTPAIAAILEVYINQVSSGPSTESINEAIKSMSYLIVRFLDSWDGYLRENLYAGGVLLNNELELLAYEASYALSSLSSIVSLKSQSLENDPNTDITEHFKSWQTVFTDSYMNTIERQISALGPALDDAYYILNTGARPAAGERPNPDLPSTVIHAITYNLDYWQTVVNNMGKTNDPATGGPPSQAALAPFPTLTRASVTMLQRALITQAGIWQTLILGQQTLRSFTAESVTKRILNDFMVQFEGWVRQEMDAQVKTEAQRLQRPLIVIGILALVIVGGGIVLLAVTGQLQSLAAVIALFVGSVLTLVSGALTRAGSLVAPPGNQSASSSSPANNASMQQRLGSLFGQAGEAIVTVFQDAYKQILIEFDDLNHYVAISYPLLEFFITNSTDLGVDVKDGYSFLINVVWNDKERKAELDRVVRAAFGPLGALIGTPTLDPAQKKPAPPAA
jgi:hypothetical protein